VYLLIQLLNSLASALHAQAIDKILPRQQSENFYLKGRKSEFVDSLEENVLSGMVYDKTYLHIVSLYHRILQIHVVLDGKRGLQKRRSDEAGGVRHEKDVGKNEKKWRWVLIHR
jgi:hypothetical protein